MRISIWQQFSSNHSNNFQVVGVFKSVETAVEAREKLREILHLVLEFGIDYQDGVPNFAEFVTAKEFDIEWPQTLDWVSDEMHEVVQFDHYVWCGNIVGETWLGAPPIDKLMQKLGGEILVYQGIGLMVLAAELTCTAPNHKTAKKIFADLQPYLELLRQAKGRDQIPPWREYADKHETHYYYADHAYYGYIRQIREKLEFSKLTFARIGHGLPALIAYLRANECTDIKYSIQERGRDEVFESK